MKFIKRIFLTIFVLFIFLASSFFLWAYLNHVTPVLMYHQVIDVKNPTGEQVGIDLFEKHMRLLKEFGYRVISLEDYVESVKKGVEISRKAVVITFDDGKEDVYHNAFPILKKYDYPAIVFVPTGKVGTPGYLSWPQIKEMAAEGITFGSHTKNEVYLPNFSADEQRTEILESKKALEKMLKVPAEYFSYPTGGFTHVTKKLIKEAGYKAAVTTNRGADRKNGDLYEINRVRLSNSDKDELYIWVKFAGYSKIFKKGKNPY